jgi:transcriptional regulator with XRE-family HTH domain
MAIVFRAILREMREECGLTQAQLADRLSMPQSYVSKYETGERRLDLVETSELCAALGVKLSEFIKHYESRAFSVPPSASRPGKKGRNR